MYEVIQFSWYANIQFLLQHILSIPHNQCSPLLYLIPGASIAPGVVFVNEYTIVNLVTNLDLLWIIVNIIIPQYVLVMGWCNFCLMYIQFSTGIPIYCMNPLNWKIIIVFMYIKLSTMIYLYCIHLLNLKIIISLTKRIFRGNLLIN
jgi:hypothetical protein